MDLKIIFMVESWGEPWNEGYKNLAKYIAETLYEDISRTYVVTKYDAEKLFVNKDLIKSTDIIYVFNYNGVPSFLAKLYDKVIIKEVAKKDFDVDIKTKTKYLLKSKFIWDYVVVPSENLKSEFSEFTGMRNIAYLPPPIPTSWFRKLDKDYCRKALGLDSNSFYVGYTGTINEYRRIDIIFEALYKLKKVFNIENVVLLLSLANIQRRALDKFKKLLELYKGKIKIKLVRTNDVRLFYSAIDLLIYPVKRRGSIEPPLTVLEAMSCETPVAALNNEVTSKIIKHESNGFLFSKSEELAKIIFKVLKEEVPILLISRKARTTVIDYYDLEKLRNKYLKFLSLLYIKKLRGENIVPYF